MEELDATGEATLEELELQTYVDVGVGFPGDVVRTLSFEGRTDIAGRGLDGVQVDIAVGTDVVVTLRTYRSLQLQLVNPGYVEPLLLREAPGAAQRPEGTPAVVGVEAAAGIATDRAAGEVALVPVVHAAEEVTLVVVLRLVGG